MARTRRRAPYNPASPVHDRRTTDKLKDAQLAPQEVDDPFEIGAKIIVMRQIRNDPLARLHSRNDIDEAQYQGGRAFQNDFETAERGPRAIDPSKEAVDGGLMPEPITEAQREAGRSLARAHRELGADGAALMYDFLIDGRTTMNIAERRGFAGQAWADYFGKRIRECLHRLAFVYGFAKEKTGKLRKTL